MRPLPTILEAAQAREIEQLKAELSHYKRLSAYNSVATIWDDPKELVVQDFLPPTLSMNMLASAKVDIGEFDFHALARTQRGLQVGYYATRESLLYSPAIQADILQKLMEKVTYELIYKLTNGEI